MCSNASQVWGLILSQCHALELCRLGLTCRMLHGAVFGGSIGGGPIGGGSIGGGPICGGPIVSGGGGSLGSDEDDVREIWANEYARIFGEVPPDTLNASDVRRRACVSEVERPHPPPDSLYGLHLRR